MGAIIGTVHNRPVNAEYPALFWNFQFHGKYTLDVLTTIVSKTEIRALGEVMFI